jgi:hypothetical protein
MSAGYVADRIDHRENDQSEGQCNAHVRDRATAGAVDHNCAGAREHETEGANEFS